MSLHRASGGGRRRGRCPFALLTSLLLSLAASGFATAQGTGGAAAIRAAGDLLAARAASGPATADAADSAGSAPQDMAALREELQRARTARADIEATSAQALSGEVLTARLRAATRLVDLLSARTAGDSVPPRPLPVPLSLAGPPPHAVADVDRLRDQQDSLLAQRAALQPLALALETDRQQASLRQRQSSETLRLRREQLERAGTGAAAARVNEELQLAELEQRVAELELLRDDAALNAARDRLAALAVPIRTLDDRVETARRSQRIDEADLDAVRREVAAQRGRDAALRRQLESAGVARPKGAAAAGSGPPPMPNREALAALRELDAVVAGREAVWLQRQSALAAARGDAQRRQSAQRALAQSLEQARAHDRAIGERLVVLRSELQLQRARADTEPAAAATALGAVQAQLAVNERLQAELARMVVLLERSAGDLLLGDGGSGGPEGWTRVGEVLRGWLAKVWEFELFSATDTVVVEGRPVTLDYGVTVGKSIGVVLLFGLGGWLAARMSRRLIDTLVRRNAIGAPLGRVLYRWVMSVLLLAVLWGVLRLARIPLTAFAFVGGALAIGIGFAAQNLLKNLMSGAIILFERKIRVGDIVTVGGVSGTVVAVDLRSTTVLGFDGIDSILPNSYLLENLVADWSHGAGQVRSELLVPVAYGCDSSAVAQRLLELARAHPKVLHEPSPEVLLHDFGASGLVFKLWVWTSLSGGRAAALVASDLRLTIDRELRASVIGTPRTLHEVAVTSRAG